MGDFGHRTEILSNVAPEPRATRQATRNSIRMNRFAGRTGVITIYGGGPSRSFRVLWALEELGLDYRLHAVDLRKRPLDEAFIKCNPAGFLPAFDDDGVVMV